MNQPSYHSANETSPRKRKHSDSSGDEQADLNSDSPIPCKLKPLSEQPIENDIETLDDGLEREEEEELDEGTKALKKQEYQEILEAQEDATETSYGDIKITPFNLQEELEEGKFDASGNYIPDKEKLDSENNDAWAESVDWDAVERKAREEEERKKSAMQTGEEEDSDEEDTGSQVTDKISSYKQMLRLMRPDETVQKTIRRMGDAIPKPVRPQRRKTSQETEVDKAKLAADTKEARAKLDLMIELAHHRLEEGEVDIYQMSYEDLEEAIN